MELYEVLAKCGHVGSKNYVEKTFAVEAKSGKEAAALVRYTPRVKHDQKYAIRSVSKIDSERYAEIINANQNDPYFSCRNIQDQRRLCNLDIKPEEMETTYSREKCQEHSRKKREPYKRMNSRDLMNYYEKEKNWLC